MKRILIIMSVWFMPFIILAQSPNQNYIKTTTYQDIGGVDSNITIQYFDGLGRPIENVLKAITPQGKDLVNITQYDGLGREYKHWLPAVATGNTGAYVDTTSFKSLASTQYGTSEKPYATTKYEPCPLNRVTGQYGAGAVWYSNSKKVDISYQSNADAEVAYFIINSSNHLQRTGTYAANTLFKTTVTDEDGKTTTEYKDKLRQVVMKQSSTNVKTYYVYDDFGRLRYVLPPIAADSLPASGQINDDNGVLKRYAYLYKYDERGNNVVKRLPGCDSICMVYDKADRLILSQDGNQRKEKKWVVTKYDALGRVVYTGTLDRDQNRVSLKSILDPLVITESYNGSATFYNTGYTCGYFVGDVTPLSVNYYDNYAFRKMQTKVADTTKLIYTTLTGYDAQYPNSKGMLTGTRTYILDKSDSYLVTAFYYDDRGRIVQTCSSNQEGGYDLTYTHYDFTGKVLNTYKKHNISGQSVITETYTYVYDNAGRPTVTTYKFNNDAPITTFSSKKYDELGRLQYNYRHNAADTIEYAYNIRNWTTQIKNGTFSEYLNYNIQANFIATPCFNGNIASATYNYNGTYRTYDYWYDQLNRLTGATSFQFSGGIPSSDINSETFAYDKQGNIKGLSRQNGTTTIDNLTLKYNGNQLTKVTDQYGSQNLSAVKEYNDAVNLPTEFYYDKNGNMKTDLDRNIVTIRYNLLNLPDTIQFKNGNQIFNRYAADGRKLSTTYVTRKLALANPIDTSAVYKWVYDRNQMSVTGTTYIGNVEYSTTQTTATTRSCNLQRVHNEEGYADNINSTYVSTNYYYLRRDHLGNTREVWRAPYTIFVANNILNPASVVQRTQYYASGLPWAVGEGASTQPYKYNGKEFVEMHGYDTYDYGARGYYAAIMRFSTQDPRAEKYYNLSPYNYCANNPILFIDPNGDTISVTSNSGKYLFMLNDGKNGVTSMTAKALYKQGTQWFEPEADNYMPLIGTAEGLEGFSELKHFTWKQITDFSEVDRMMISYRQDGSGDWKASKEGAAGYFLITVDGKPYWSDAIGQIPFAVDKFTDELMSNKGNTERSILNTIDAGREYGGGKLVGGTRDNSNTYDNYFILRGALWANQRYIMLYDKNNQPFLHNTGRSNNYLTTPIAPSLRNKYL